MKYTLWGIALAAAVFVVALLPNKPEWVFLANVGLAVVALMLTVAGLAINRGWLP